MKIGVEIIRKLFRIFRTNYKFFIDKVIRLCLIVAFAGNLDRGQKIENVGNKGCKSRTQAGLGHYWQAVSDGVKQRAIGIEPT